MSVYDSIQKWMENSIVDEILLLALLIAFVESIAQNTLKNSEHGSFKFIVGLSFYMIIGYILHYGYHRFPLGKLNTIWSCISIILAILIGASLYDEPVNKWTIVSIVLSIGAIYFSFLASD